MSLKMSVYCLHVFIERGFSHIFEGILIGGECKALAWLTPTRSALDHAAVQTPGDSIWPQMFHVSEAARTHSSSAL